MKRFCAACALLVASAASAHAGEIPSDAYGRAWPDRAPYRGGPVPSGYHVETHVRSGLLIAGAITLGISYGVAVAIAAQPWASDEVRAFYAPLVGPFIFAALVQHDDTYGFATAIGILLGIIQTGGATMLSLAFIPKREVVRDDTARIHFAPIVTPNHAGLALYGAF